MPVDAVSDVDLARRLAARDTAALEQLYDRYGGLAYSVALRVLGDSGRAEDVVQEAFLRLWNSAERFDERRGSLRVLLLTTVRNRSIDYLRGRAAHQRREREIPVSLSSEGPGSDPWQEVALHIEREAVRAAMITLPVEQRQAVEMAYFGGYTHREIAEMTQVPLSTVKGRMRLALEKLHSYLQGRGFEE